MRKIKVLVADDHAIVRSGLVALLEIQDGLEVVGAADDGAAAVQLALKAKPDVVIMDLLMPVKDGFAATEELKTKLPSCRVLVLTTSNAADDLSRALAAGADGIVMKNAPNDELIGALRAVAHGRRAVSPAVERMIAMDSPIPKLTDRQMEILASITRGLTNAEIARQFGISTPSVKDHINAIFTKLGAANRTEAVAIALRKHLLKI